MGDVLVDANVFMSAAGGDHPYREPCRAVVRALAGGVVDGLRPVVDAELFQEIAYRYASIGKAAVGVEMQRSVLALGLPVLPIDEGVVRSFLACQQRHAGLSARDLLHVAVAVHHGVDVVLTADRDFDRVPEVRRLDPRDVRS